MEQKKRKISIRKIIQLFVTIVVTAGCIFAVLSASKIQDKRTVRDMQVHIRNKNSCGFLHEQQVKEMLINSRHISLKETPVTQLNIRNMEAIMRSNPWIATSEVYVDNTGTLHVFIEQRVPAFRVFEQDGNSYYIDTTLKILPLSDQYTHYTTVVTNVPELKEDSTGKSLKVQIMKMVQAISTDTFWNAQVAEIRLAADQTFELVPVLGDHRIIMGDTSRIEEKLNHVFNFYKQVLNRIGWNKYQVINASYQGQIVATPALPWKPPKDKAMSNMNWVKSIMGSAPPDNSASAILSVPVTAPAQKTTLTATQVKPDTIKPATVKPDPAKQANGPAAENKQKVVNPPAIKPKETANTPRQVTKQAVDNKRTAATPDQTNKNTAPPKTGLKEQGKETGGQQTNTPKYIYQGNSN